MIKDNGEIVPAIMCATCPINVGCSWGCLRGDDLAEIAALRRRVEQLRRRLEAKSVVLVGPNTRFWRCQFCQEMQTTPISFPHKADCFLTKAVEGSIERDALRGAAPSGSEQECDSRSPKSTAPRASQSKGRMRRGAGMTQMDRHVTSDTSNIIPVTTVKGETL